LKQRKGSYNKRAKTRKRGRKKDKTRKGRRTKQQGKERKN